MSHRLLHHYTIFILTILITQMNLTTNTTYNTTTTGVNATYTHQPVEIVLATNSIASTFIQSAVRAYQLVNPDITITVTVLNDLDVKDAVGNNQADIGFYTGSPTPADQATYPELLGYPVLATGVSPVYNLPSTITPPGFTLALRSTTLAQIYTGDIQYWDHPLIVHDNNNATFLPHQPIQLVINTDVSGTTNIFSHAMNSTYTPFGVKLGVGFTMDYSHINYTVPPIPVTGFAADVATVMLTPYSLTVATAEEANQLLYTGIGDMINAAGRVVTMSSDTVGVAAIEQGVSSQIGVFSDFSNGASPYAFPIAGPILLLYNLDAIRTTCQAKTNAIEFILWLKMSASVAALTTTISILPSLVLAVSDYTTRTPRCNGVPMVLGVSSGVSVIGGTDAVSTYINTVLAFYQNVDVTRSYSFVPTDQFTALDQLMQGEISVAVVEPDYLNHTNLARWTTLIDTGDIKVLPAAVEYAVPAFNLPKIIRNLTDTTLFSTTLYGETAVPGKYGITVDLPTLSSIWTGNIVDWTHPNISQYVPWLAERITYLQRQQPNIKIPITLVVCCENVATSTPALQVIAYGMYASIAPGSWFNGVDFTPQPFNSLTQIPSNYNTWQLPFTFLTNLTTLSKNVHTIMLQNELAMAATIQQIDSAIGYYMATNDGQDVSTEMSIVFPPAPGQPSKPYSTYDYNIASVDGALACIIPQTSTDINRFSVQMDSVYQSSSCWAFTSLVSVAVLSHYESDAAFPDTISNANHTLQMLLWLTNNTALQPTARSSGIGLLSMLPEYNAQVVHELQYITCDGVNCLITLPTYWHLSMGVVAFGYALAAIMILVCTVTAVCVWRFRKRVVIRSASVTFLLLILQGIVLVFTSSIFIVQPPTLQSCSAFAWLANFGLLFTFVPIFLKMYRIYKIFSRKQLKIVKLTDTRLLMYGSVFVVVDFAIMSAWQGGSPLQPLTTHMYSGVDDRQYLQCNLTQDGVPYVVTLGVLKAALLLFGCVMSFSTRKVTGTFNESTSVAWSIYNTILATAILIPIIAFVGAVGDTLIVLILIISLWIGVSIYAFLFGTKMYTLIRGDVREQVSALESNRTMTGGFSFVSVDVLTHQTVAQYLAALKTHTRAVEAKQKQLHENTTGDHSSLPPGPSSKYRAGVASPSGAVSPARRDSHAVSSVHEQRSHAFSHETIAPIRREAPSFVTVESGSAVLNARKLSSTNVVTGSMVIGAVDGNKKHSMSSQHDNVAG